MARITRGAALAYHSDFIQWKAQPLRFNLPHSL